MIWEQEVRGLMAWVRGLEGFPVSDGRYESLGLCADGRRGVQENRIEDYNVCRMRTARRIDE